MCYFRCESAQVAEMRLRVRSARPQEPGSAGAVRLVRTAAAHAEGPDHDKALDQLSERLERQLRDHHEKRRTRRLAGARSAVNKRGLESAHAGPVDADTSEEAEDRGTRGT